MFNRKEASSRFWSKLRLKENMIIQKSRLKLLNERDSNTGFFHKAMKERRRHNHISPINSRGVLVDLVLDINEEVQSYFSLKFCDLGRNRAFLDGISFNTIKEEDNHFLKSPFGKDEIKEAI